jgi:hypothetical protein
MFACMVGAPPQPADQRKKNDKMDMHIRKLEGIYSPELLRVIRWTLMLDPLARPQSVFALQKALREPVQEVQPLSFMQVLGNKLQVLFSKFGKRITDRPGK